MNIKTHLGRIQITLPILSVVSNIFLIFIATVSIRFARNERPYGGGVETNFIFIFFFSAFLILFFSTLLLNLIALIKQNYQTAYLFILMILDLLILGFLLAFTPLVGFERRGRFVYIPLEIILPISILAFLFNLIHLILASIHFSKNLAANKN